jgi:hypothetical protein
MPDTGYNVYRGTGGLGTVDFATRVGYVAAGNDAISLVGLGHVAGATYTYVVRPVVDDLETPDYSAAIEVPITAGGEWAGDRPVAVASLSAEPIAAGKIRLRWQYTTPRNGATPLLFAIYHETDPIVDASGSPDAFELYTADGWYTKDLTLVDGVSYWLAILTTTSGGAKGPAVFIGPRIADATAPGSPTIYTDAVY